ncbi:MAG: glycosyltransferase [Pseudomonadales bacterium]|nr:glycosyltransferase [Pseudomonadales bacterium]
MVEQLWNPSKRTLEEFSLIRDELLGFVNAEMQSAAQPNNEEDLDWPRISIITPSFNQAAFLEHTILSIINQSYQNLQFIVVDGGSTDGSVEILKQYDTFIDAWISEPDEGQAFAINKGLRMADGDWVAYQNSDDIYLPGALRYIGRKLLGLPNADVVYGDILKIDSDYGVRDIQINVRACPFAQLVDMQMNNQCTFWRRELLDASGYFDESYSFCMDYEYYTRLLMGKAGFAKVTRLIGAQRHHKQSKTSTMQAQHHKEKRQVQSLYSYGLSRILPLRFRAIIVRAYKVLWHLKHANWWYLVRNF